MGSFNMFMLVKIITVLNADKPNESIDLSIGLCNC